MACGLVWIVLSAAALPAGSATQSLSSLGWKEKSFSGHTRYSLEARGSKLAIKGETDGSASALYRDVTVDLESTPFLSWQWKVSNVFVNSEERKKSGDDFPARLYVIYQRGFFKWNTVAINYVWSSENAVGETWKSAYTSKSRIVVLQSGDTNAGNWVSEKRNVAEDFKTLFGIDVSNLNGYAVMVDGDNTSSAATAWFADIAFHED